VKFWFLAEVHGSGSSFSGGRSFLTLASRPGAAAVRERKPAFVVCGLFGLGAPELLVIAGVAALLFGPKQLPQLGKKLGQSVKSFQQVGRGLF
jgi:sec-independent protein translocase protein TatA